MMPTPDAQQPSTAYRLTGEISGSPRSFVLTVEAVRLGGHSDNDLVLDAAGISRYHAVLRPGQGGVDVEDLGSKNGTFINGVRSTSGRLRPGDELALGSARLRLESAHPGDGQLGLSLAEDPDSTTQDGRTLDQRETDLLESRHGDGPGFGWLEAMVDHLASSRPTRRGAAIEALREALGAHGVLALSWRPGRQALVADAGDGATRLESCRPAVEAAAERADRLGTWQLERVPGGEPVLGVLPVVRGEVLVLAVFGAVAAPGQLAACLRLAGTLLLAVHPLDRDPQDAAPARGALSFPAGHVMGRSAIMRRLYREMETVARGDYPILILGETGCGKEMLAQTLHRSSPRAKGPLVTVNCAAIPAELLEAEMFGVVRGAATGVSARQGLFSKAQGGTLFLDEIGDMRRELQAKLLRALEYGEVQPVGGSPTQVDVRVVSATHVDLERRIEDGQFRADLYYRLAASVLEVPALRERTEDLPLLIQALLQNVADELAIRPRGVTQHALDRLLAYPWPGNVRELRHELRRAAQKVAPGGALDSSHLSPKFLRSIKAPGAKTTTGSASSSTPQSLNLKARVAEVEKEVIAQALEQAGGNRTVTAQLLGVSRNTLATKIALYDLA